MNIYDQLQAVEDRYEELGELLSDPDVVSDTKRFMALSKEEANTRETVTVYREYKQILRNGPQPLVADHKCSFVFD